MSPFPFLRGLWTTYLAVLNLSLLVAGRFGVENRHLQGKCMFRPRISLKWFLFGTTLAAVLIGTVGKRTYDDWRRRRWFAQQQRISEDLKSARSGVHVRDGRVVGVQTTPATDGSQAMAWLKDATELETLSTRSALTDNDVAVLKSHSKLLHLSIDAPGRSVTNNSLRSIGELG
jgi:hypothetical protein